MNKFIVDLVNFFQKSTNLRLDLRLDLRLELLREMVDSSGPDSNNPNPDFLDFFSGKQDLEYPTSLGNGPTKNRSGFQRITSRKKKGQTTMKRQHLRTRADDTICVAQTGSVNGGMCRSSVKGKMSS